MSQSDKETVLSKAIKYLGGRRAVADELGITYQAVDKWSSNLPAERARDLATLSKAKFTLEQLRPDLFPDV